MASDFIDHQQELADIREMERLRARIAELERERDKLERYKVDSIAVHTRDLDDKIALRSERDEARAEVAMLRGAIEADENRLRDAASAAGVAWFGCDTPQVMADTLAERTRERDEARELAVWLANTGCNIDWSWELRFISEDDSTAILAALRKAKGGSDE